MSLDPGVQGRGHEWGLETCKDVWEVVLALSWIQDSEGSRLGL